VKDMESSSCRYGKIRPISLVKFLEYTSQRGVSINNIAHTTIKSYIVTNACEHGLRGYNLLTGKAWRLKLPNWITASYHIHLLEFIASLIGIWLETIDDEKTNYT